MNRSSNVERFSLESQLMSPSFTNSTHDSKSRVLPANAPTCQTASTTRSRSKFGHTRNSLSPAQNRHPSSN
ncbi:hypothetical protein DM02DRAFT_266180 [Periconia macrospinosa]|uniref:Uncharacterized protein n=1 Tax=Periconia macrospinosa TaxID=97972 RepID=A0A2V1D426_9PLEO|nr:hypothetical protein DM02DRAFT_266180 [Periconia macrospinosa]